MYIFPRKSCPAYAGRLFHRLCYRRRRRAECSAPHPPFYKCVYHCCIFLKTIRKQFSDRGKQGLCAVRRSPLLGSLSLTGRQADFFERQSSRRRTGSSQGSAALRLQPMYEKRGSGTWVPASFWLLFPRGKSNPGTGAGSPGIIPRSDFCIEQEISMEFPDQPWYTIKKQRRKEKNKPWI